MAPSLHRESTRDKEGQLTRDQVINKLNYLNFLDIPLIVRFRHKTLQRVLRLPAIPEACQNGYGFYRWSPEQKESHVPPQFKFQDLLINDGNRLIVIRPANHRWDTVGGVFELPEQCQVLNARSSRRYLCQQAVGVELIQNSTRFIGELIDFSASSLMVSIKLVPPQAFAWIDPDVPVHVILADEQEVCFAAECQIFKTRWGLHSGTCILRPSCTQVKRFKPKRFRSERLNIQPPPNLVFHHPLTGRLVEMTVKDISGSGLAVETNRCQDSLIPGMVLRKAQLIFAGGATFDCRLQVIYTHDAPEDNPEIVRSGFAILDIPPEQHTRLLALIYQTNEPNAYINQAVDPEALWRFFFDTGFIYPEKYIHIQQHKALIQSTFEKLYTRHPSFARHFTYQRMGRVLGHMSMLRFYNRSWMIQHHAAKTAESHRAGLIVLEQIGRYINDAHRLYQSQMDYVFCIYRPENKFPSRVFGGAAIAISDPHICSRDTFAYLHLPHQPMEPNQRMVGNEWRLVPSNGEDLAELSDWYSEKSGGLMMKAFNLVDGDSDIQMLSDEYRAIGFRRERRLFTLRRKGRPVAVFVANRSDIGLNMSDLTNCIQVFVIDLQPGLSNVIYRALTKIINWYPDIGVPVMIYPDSAAEHLRLPAEKKYTSWVLNLDHTDRYFEYISRLIKIANRSNEKTKKDVYRAIQTDKT